MTTTSDTRPRRPGPKLPELALTDEERATLRAGPGGARPARRWPCGVGSCWPAPRATATRRSWTGWCLQPTVTRWRARFLTRRLEGLADEPRPGAARTITDKRVEQVLVPTLETTPPDATHRSTRSLARQLGMSQWAISRIWRALGSNPTWSTPSTSCPIDLQFMEKVRDVAGCS
jgi:hypothetical protein